MCPGIQLAQHRTTPKASRARVECEIRIGDQLAFGQRDGYRQLHGLLRRTYVLP